MNTINTMSFNLADSTATEYFGEQIGQKLRGGEIIELISDLGGGKTTLARGIVRGTGSTDVVASPTFALSKVYKAPKYEIVHYDFYRLAEAGILEFELHDNVNDASTVTIIEWGEIVQHILPDKRLTINIKVTSDGTRNLLCGYPKDLEYLLA